MYGEQQYFDRIKKTILTSSLQIIIIMYYIIIIIYYFIDPIQIPNTVIKMNCFFITQIHDQDRYRNE